MAVLYTFRAPSLGHQVHCELMRSALLDLTPIMPATAYHQRNYVERYSRCRATMTFSGRMASPQPKRHGLTRWPFRLHSVAMLMMYSSNGLESLKSKNASPLPTPLRWRLRND